MFSCINGTFRCFSKIFGSSNKISFIVLYLVVINYFLFWGGKSPFYSHAYIDTRETCKHGKQPKAFLIWRKETTLIHLKWGSVWIVKWEMGQSVNIQTWPNDTVRWNFISFLVPFDITPWSETQSTYPRHNLSEPNLSVTVSLIPLSSRRQKQSRRIKTASGFATRERREAQDEIVYLALIVETYLG